MFMHLEKNEYGNLGLGFKETKVTTPKKLDGKYKEIHCGYSHTFLVDMKNNYQSCGSNQYGQILLNHSNDQTTITPVNNFKNKINKISAGYECTIVIDSDCKMYSIGYNNFGLCGVGHTNNLTKLVEVTKFLPRVKFCAVEIGYEHCVAKTTNDKLFSWGHNQHGQLGLGDNEKRTMPTEVTVLPESVSSFWCGHNQTFVISKTRNAYSCGYNTYGELCLGDTNNRNILTRITTLSNVMLLSKKPDLWFAFKVLYFGRKTEHKIWRKVPIEIIKEICKFI